MRVRLVLAAAWLCALTCVFAAWRPPVAALYPLVWFGCLWVPGLALVDPADLRAGGRSRLEALWMPLATGPVLFGLVVCALGLAGWDIPRAAVVAPVLGAGLATLLQRRGGEAIAEATPRRVWIALLVVGGVILLCGALPSLVNESLRLRADARLHLPVIHSVLLSGLPPENPFLAGEPLAYFWFFHAVLAGVGGLLPVAVDWIPAWCNAQALAVLLLAINETGRRHGVSALGRGAAMALVAVGLSPFGFAKLLTTQHQHPELNWATIRASGSRGMFPLLSFGEPRMASALTKIAITNALPMSLALSTLALLPIRGGRQATVRLVVVVGAALFHLAAGLLLLAGLATAGAVRVLGRAGLRRSGLGLLATAGIALAVVLPYAATVLGGRDGGTPAGFGFDPSRVRALHLGLAGLWALSLPVLLSWARDDARRVRLLVAIPALAVTLFVQLIDGNEYKGAFVLLWILAPIAGEGLGRLARGRVWLALVLLLPFLPGSYFALRTYAEETPENFLQPSVRTALREAADQLPESAVVWRLVPGTRGYSPWTLELRRPFYLSDPYALRILGQWTSPTARVRSQELSHAAQGQYGISLAAAARAVAPRPLFVLVPETDRLAYPRFEILLRAAGAVVHAEGPGFRLYAAPGSTEAGSGTPR